MSGKTFTNRHADQSKHMVDPENAITPDHDSIESNEEQQSAYSHLEDDGSLRIVQWAVNEGISDAESGAQTLTIPDEDGEYEMAHSSATGDALVSNGDLGIDMIRIDAGDGFVPHTHPGDHILIPVYGEGTITYDGAVYPTQAGTVYIIAGEVPHGVGAITDHAILAVGSPHAPVDSAERMEPVEYDKVTTEINHINCLICEESVQDGKLHKIGCDHCPCHDCLG